ncbi:HXXEE domain-containing protein [Ancylobacter oerskovii]|uniref:HXXEE domain-containing protein n=1 Tax=Ancylobacter oerskovii TaxID=459519 RepID=A0ABW4YRR5_9HYPH|nr:HXXEE domain-containing protein [Ancylobacter oerskovii]MBS7545373.1 HXXEE domain-containing protein [Ancylobacter oerskovii]
MPSFAHGWPYIGLGLAAALLFALAFADLRGDRSRPRLRDPVWLAWAAMAAYLIHQFEEHGIDAEGAHYAFRGMLCGTFGHADAASCPIPPAFITAVNIPVVWVAGPAYALLGRHRPALALAFFSVPAVNAVAHIGPALAERSYNPGLLTAALLFLPLSLWAFRVALATPGLGARAVIATLAGGVLLHAVLLLSLKAYLAGLIGETALIAVQVANPAIPGLLMAAVMRGRTLRGRT